MMGIKDRSFSALPHDISLEDLVPKENFYRRLAEHAGPLLREGAGAGRPSVDPVCSLRSSSITRLGHHQTSEVSNSPSSCCALPSQP